jgi:serine/threonine protein kinase
MTATRSVKCPRCAAVRAAHSTPLDLCPTCLLATALAMDDDPCPYQVIAPLGAGSSGVTYLAQALSGIGGYVALKIVGPRHDADAVLSRYQYWKPALAAIQHPGVGKLLGVGLTVDGLLYVASDYVAGWPLTALASHGSMNQHERIDLADQLTSAVDAIHAAGLVHLKLNPSNAKISTANGLRATILGLGSSVIVDGLDGSPDVDRLALARMVRELGIER